MWYEKYRPGFIAELLGNEKQVNNFLGFSKTLKFSNLIIYGSTGTGKTSCNFAFLNEIFSKIKNVYLQVLNSLDDNGINSLKSRLKQYENFMLVDGIFINLIVIENSDFLSISNQMGLREILENLNSNVNFLLLCKSLFKINPVLESRCITIGFNYPPFLHLIIRLKEIIEKEKIFITLEFLENIISLGNGDIRKTFNLLLEKMYIFKKKKQCICPNSQFFSKISIQKLKESSKKENRLIFSRKLFFFYEKIDASILYLNEKIHSESCIEINIYKKESSKKIFKNKKESLEKDSKKRFFSDQINEIKKNSIMKGKRFQ